MCIVTFVSLSTNKYAYEFFIVYLMEAITTEKLVHVNNVLLLLMSYTISPSMNQIGH
jgi:hypothetical protein